MNKTAILDIVKKNLLSVICGVVALIALIALLYPLSGMFERFQTTLNDAKKPYERSNNLLLTPRYLPIVQTGSTDRVKLAVFPNKKVIDKGQAAKEKVHQQSVTLTSDADKLNQFGHDLLVPGSLPEPGDKRFDFVNNYSDTVLIPPAGQNVDPKNTTNLSKLLGSVMPPDTAEVAAVSDQIWARDYEPRVVSVGGTEVNRKQLESEFKLRTANLAEELRDQRATQYQLYMDRAALAANPVALRPNTPKPTDVWYSQLGLWIEFDVAGAIINANRDANMGPQNKPLRTPSILNDPVKRLVHLDVAMGPTVYVLNDAQLAAANTSGALQGGAPPATPASDPKPPGENGFPRDFTKSPTGRTCTDKYAVCQFSVALEVDQRQIPLILDELQRGKLMTVTDVNLLPIDNAAALANGFVYGNAPMVQITLSCEAIFMRSWTAGPPENPSGPMPPEVRKLLGWDVAPAAPAPAAR